MLCFGIRIKPLNSFQGMDQAKTVWQLLLNAQATPLQSIQQIQLEMNMLLIDEL